MNENTDNDPVDNEPKSNPAGPSINGTAARITDIALGIGAAAVESLDNAARSLDHAVRNAVENAPGILDDLEEKGKPVRERLAALIANTPLPGQRPGGQAQPQARAQDDIAHLEARVRELESQQANVPASTIATADPDQNVNGESPFVTMSTTTTDIPQIPAETMVETPSAQPVTDDTPRPYSDLSA